MNIACGANLFVKPWLNVDLVDMFDAYMKHLINLDPAQMDGWPAEQVEFSRQLTARNVVFRQVDALQGFPDSEDGSCEALYAGQFLEHLNPLYELPKLLAECLRLLAPCGRLRITTPDMRRILSVWKDDDMMRFAKEQPAYFAECDDEDMRLSYLLFGATGPDSTRTNYEGHHHIWTVKTLSKVLLDAGFSEVEERPELTGLFADCRDYGMSHSMALEAVK